MGLFKIDYNKDGPGVSKNEPKKNRFFLFWELYFRKFGKFVVLNLIYCVSLLTVIGIGPATAGFTYVLRNFSREQHAFVWGDFIDTAKKNLKQGIIVGLLNLAAFFIIVIAIMFYYYNYMNEQYAGNWILLLPLMLSILCGVAFLFMQYYIYIMMVTFDLTIKQLYKNAAILAFYGLPKNVLTTLIIAVCTFFVATPLYGAITEGGQLALEFNLFSFTLLFLWYFSFVGFVAVFNSYPIIKKTMIDPYYAEQKRKEEARKEAAAAAGEPLEEDEDERIFSDERIDPDKKHPPKG